MILLACHSSACDPDDESYQGMNEISVNRFLSLGQVAKLAGSGVKEVRVVIFSPIKASSLCKDEN